MSHHAFYHREYIAPEMIEARKMMDEMRYEYRDGMNVLMMKKMIL